MNVTRAYVWRVLRGEARKEIAERYQGIKQMEKRPTRKPLSVQGAGELVSEPDPAAQPVTARTSADIRAAINMDKTYTLSDMRELCEIPHVGKWQDATLKQLKFLCFHVQDPLVFSWLSAERVEVDREASAALQKFYAEIVLPYLEDGQTNDTFSARVARHQRVLDAAFLKMEIDDLKGGSQQQVEDMKKELAQLRKPARKRRKP